MASVAPLIVIVGPTASGKSSLAMRIAQDFDGEIICADSRTIYRGMNIGTAKPSLQDQQSVTHHLLDVVQPDDAFTVADFQRRALAVIRDITSRGKLPILVGGTGLYIDSVMYNFSFRSTDAVERTKLERMTTAELQQAIQAAGYVMPSNDQNPRHLIRTLESKGQQSVANPLRENTLILGLNPGTEVLAAHIAARVDDMIAAGLEQEAQQLFAKYGMECRPLRTIGYQEFLPYFDNQQSLEQVVAKIIVSSRQYAKRQHTWFKRNKSIHWLQEQIEYVDLITSFLNKK